jgi:ankyrin repeat protein
MKAPLSAVTSQENVDDFFLNIQVENTDIVLSYLDAGMPLTVRNADGHSPLQVSVFEGCVDISLAFIERGAPSSEPGRNGGSLLHDASWNGTLTEALLAKEADPTQLDFDGRDAFYRAAENGALRSMRLLAAAGCSVTAPGVADGVGGVRPIHAAASNYDLEAVLTIIDLGENPTVMDALDRNVIHYGAKSRYVGVLTEPEDFSNFVRSMQDRGVDINAPDFRGQTPISYAAPLNDPHQASVLLALGAKRNIPDNDGILPEEIASEKVKQLLSSVKAIETVAHIEREARYHP